MPKNIDPPEAPEPEVLSNEDFLNVFYEEIAEGAKDMTAGTQVFTLTPKTVVDLGPVAFTVKGETRMMPGAMQVGETIVLSEAQLRRQIQKGWEYGQDLIAKGKEDEIIRQLVIDISISLRGAKLGLIVEDKFRLLPLYQFQENSVYFNQTPVMVAQRFNVSPDVVGVDMESDPKTLFRVLTEAGWVTVQLAGEQPEIQKAERLWHLGPQVDANVQPGSQEATVQRSRRGLKLASLGFSSNTQVIDNKVIGFTNPIEAWNASLKDADLKFALMKPQLLEMNDRERRAMERATRRLSYCWTGIKQDPQTGTIGLEPPSWNDQAKLKTNPGGRRYTERAALANMSVSTGKVVPIEGEPGKFQQEVLEWNFAAQQDNEQVEASEQAPATA